MTSEPLLERLIDLLPQWVAAQRWFSRAETPPRSVKVLHHEYLREAWPRLLWTIVEIDGDATYQIPLGIRRAAEIGGVLLGHEDSRIGNVETDEGELIIYDALIDSVLGRVLFDVISDGTQQVKSMRPLGAEQSNTSLVFDNRLILKVFRRIQEGPNPDLEVTRKLSELGFRHVAPVVAVWERGDHDLAVCQPYLFDGTEGWKLALASVRDYLGVDTQGGSGTPGSPAVRIDTRDPAAAGGDFADEARRLGAVTAQLHVALAEAFGRSDFDTAELVGRLQRAMVVVTEEQQPSLQKLIDNIAGLEAGSVGRTIRIHGDYHLGQTLRSVSGWFVFDFEGEPARPMSERVLPNSPLKDVAGMVRSFHYAGFTGLREQVLAQQITKAPLAEAWERRNREAFRDGYLADEDIESLLPSDAEITSLILRGFEIEKAVYEVLYERAYRPDWVDIPLAALRRLLPA